MLWSLFTQPNLSGRYNAAKRLLQTTRVQGSQSPAAIVACVSASHPIAALERTFRIGSVGPTGDIDCRFA
jgi:hypothetical protein